MNMSKGLKEIIIVQTESTAGGGELHQINLIFVDQSGHFPGHEHFLLITHDNGFPMC
ncbi:hypothetical protein SDC9_113082 [bioreactor metagenome]|uniref:Uncharacterized protein n=1 Tax=bioreactor metagenome TaxID=1076179 RepID=A0A645BLG9_9ZZZZ